MADLTNITDTHVPSVGRTTTTLVASHDRGAQDWAARQHGGDANVPPAPGAPAPTITSLTPNTAVATAGAATVTVTGTNFTAASKIEIDGVIVPTTYVSATSLTTSYDPTTAGTKMFTVSDAGQESAAVPFTVT